MSNPWFRMYHEFLVDPKVQMLSEVDQRRFIMLLCMRCCNGDVTLQDNTVAFQLRVSNDEYKATKEVLLSAGLINEGNNPVAWDKRQYVSDSSTERVRKHREKKKQVCNVTVTPPDTDTETDTETETDIKGETKLIYGTFGNVKLTETQYEKIKQRFNGTAEERIESLSEYIASKGKRYKDHYATILSWARKEEKEKKTKQPPLGKEGAMI